MNDPMYYNFILPSIFKEEYNIVKENELMMNPVSSSNVITSHEHDHIWRWKW